MLNIGSTCPWTKSLHSAFIYHNLSILLYIIQFYTLTCELRQVPYWVILVCPVMSNTEWVCVWYIQSTSHKLQTAMKHGPMCLSTESLPWKTQLLTQKKCFNKIVYQMLFLECILNNSLWSFAATQSHVHNSRFHTNSLTCTYLLTFMVTRRQDGVNLTVNNSVIKRSNVVVM